MKITCYNTSEAALRPSSIAPPLFLPFSILLLFVPHLVLLQLLLYCSATDIPHFLIANEIGFRVDHSEWSRWEHKSRLN